MTALDSLSKMTVVVADTGEFEAIKKYAPQDATTNPSLILKAALLPEYQFLVDDAVQYGVASRSKCLQDTVDTAMDKLAVNFGKKIAENVPGFVSTEVDARLSFDTDGTVARARRIISMVRNSPSFLLTYQWICNMCYPVNSRSHFSFLYSLVRGSGREQVPYFDQDCFDLRRNKGRRNSSKRRNQLQLDTAVLSHSSGCMCGSWDQTYLPVCWENNGLA